MELALRGIIPARAGFTRTADRGEGGRGDHPRSRGVYRPTISIDLDGVGSSPLARGLPGSRERTMAEARIIPARAGFTWRRKWPRPRREDHPRSRGVYRRTRALRARAAGSSPLARGLRCDAVPQCDEPGIIPARAGFTPPRPWPRPARSWIIPARAGFTALLLRAIGERADHPRSRGVYRLSPSERARLEGSSPLARGLHRPCGRPDR